MATPSSPLDAFVKTPLAERIVAYLCACTPPMSNRVFGQQVGLTPVQVSNILYHRVIPSPRQLIRMARVLEMRVDEIFALAGQIDADDPLYDRRGAWLMVEEELLARDDVPDEEKERVRDIFRIAWEDTTWEAIVAKRRTQEEDTFARIYRGIEQDTTLGPISRESQLRYLNDLRTRYGQERRPTL